MLDLAYVGKVWPNGEVGLSREKKAHMLRTVHSTSKEDRRWNAAMLEVHGLEAAINAHQQRIAPRCSIELVEGDSCPIAEEWGRAIGSSLVAKSHRAKRGQSGISKYGAKLVRNGAYLMERSNSIGRISFLTLTLPNVSVDESLRIVRDWAEIVRTLVQRLRRTLRRYGLPGEIVGVTEVQEKRALLTGVFGLHLHLAFVGRKRLKAWSLSPKDFKLMWQSALKKYLDRPVQSYDWRSCENVQMVKKSASGYLGKYLSKGLKACERLRSLYPDVEFPACWYICTNSLRSRIKAQTIRVSGGLGLVLADILESGYEGFVAYKASVKVKVSGGEIPIGYVGRLTGDGIRAITSFIKDRRIEEMGESLIMSNSFVKSRQRDE